MTDAELQGLALQALNLAKRDFEQKHLCCLMASWHKGETIHRMKRIEDLIVEKLGRDWLNHGGKKAAAFSLLRLALSAAPPDAFIFVTAGNAFKTTEAFQKLSKEEGMAILNAGHPRHHQAVAEGLLSIQDVIQVSAQTPERVCVYIQNMDHGHFDGVPQVEFFDQKHFDGLLKMFGEAK